MAQSPNVVTVNVTGIAEAIGSLSLVQSRIENWADQLRLTVGLIVQSEADEQFNQAPRGSSGGTTYFGSSWDALSEGYLKRRPDRASGQILRDTGELLQSLQVGGSGNILQSNGMSITFGSNLAKARGLQKDRVFLIVTEVMVRIIVRAIEIYLATGET